MIEVTEEVVPLIRLGGGVTGVRRFMKTLPLVAALLIPGGCDPCSGIVGCDDEPRISLEGQIIQYTTRDPVEGVILEFVRTGGISLGNDSVTTTSNSEGIFRFEMPAMEEGEVTGDVTVTPPNHPAYTVQGVRASTTRLRGDGKVLPLRWVVDPYFDFVGEIYSNLTDRPLPYETQLKFRRTGGVEIDPDSILTQIDPFGRFVLAPKALTHGELVGELIVRVNRGNGFTDRTIRDIRLRTTHEDRPLSVGGLWTVGASLNYVGEIRYRSGSRAASGVPVEFRRTGGINARPTVLQSVSDAGGRFPLQFETEEDGELIGDLIVRLPAPLGEVVMRGIRIPTTDVDRLTLFRVWGVGPSLAYVGQLRGAASGSALGDLPVQLRRIGGVPLAQDILTARTGGDGRFRVDPVPLANGELIAELTVDLPAPQADYMTVIRLNTFESDEVRDAGVWNVPGL